MDYFSQRIAFLWCQTSSRGRWRQEQKQRQKFLKLLTQWTTTRVFSIPWPVPISNIQELVFHQGLLPETAIRWTESLAHGLVWIYKTSPTGLCKHLAALSRSQRPTKVQGYRTTRWSKEPPRFKASQKPRLSLRNRLCHLIFFSGLQQYCRWCFCNC